MNKNKTVCPIIYIPHGGGPMPLLGDPNHQGMVDFLQALPKELPKPDTILMISAHWEAAKPTITSAPNPELIYDYYGFPQEAYDITYPASGHPKFATEIHSLLTGAGIDTELDQQRGFDHGLFVPLKLMYPQADIPCVQLSLVKSFDPKLHIDIGKALAPLREKNILIIGSGMSFHNMQGFMSADKQSNEKSDAFSQWLIDTLSSGEHSVERQEKQLIHWEQAPHAHFCHPREEHLLPLHVCFGMAASTSSTAQVFYDEKMMGKRVISLHW
jgi:aromatic ring-opening dioxygenase catalytic subunit (LigB family)